jgi:hypothetical protein
MCGFVLLLVARFRDSGGRVGKHPAGVGL